MFKKFSLNVSENVSSYYYFGEKYIFSASFPTGTMKLTISHFNLSVLVIWTSSLLKLKKWPKTHSKLKLTLH